MHLLCLTFRFQLYSGKTILSAVFRVNLESATRVPKTQSIFHLRATTKRVPSRWASIISNHSPVLRDPHLNPFPGQGEADAKAPVRVEFRIHRMSLIPSAPLKLAHLPVSLAPTLVALRNQKKLSCIWIFHDGPGRKTGDIDTLSLVRCIRTRDHAFPAWDWNSIGQTSFYFFHICG